MLAKVYMSNISPLWSFERQEKLIAPALAARGIIERKDFLDELTVNERKAHHDEHLIQREQLLRRSTRRDGGLIVLASLAPWAWSVEGMMAALTRAAANKATVLVVDANITLKPKADTKAWAAAAAAFHKARKRDLAGERGAAGGNASAAKRSKEQAALSIKDEWKLSPEHNGYERTPVLLKRAGISNYATAIGRGRLRPRPDAQKDWKAELKRKAKREAKRQKEGAGAD